ncbi:zinc-ribbon domain-containing protein [Loktanella sp. SALINAS62]|uniref:zinc-ribbon domain-containing protein n=1 Tax=Loktanella sp. SALINAS62 TaxID=2706124 RepID=UPI001B8B522F|nr:zinc-ribbon domain-containing protein [Loktanella sp. SALINAS62]MBS1300999.1 hypothetical protein [Loktanella sp. SALINAS62]
MATIRLICPNCGATYEVDADVIPQDGRDVQCSNCAHTWFESRETPSATAEDPHSTSDVPPPVEREPDAAPMDDPFATQDAQDAGDAQDADDDPESDNRLTEDAPGPPPPGQRRPLEASIAEILREEAAREEAARKAEAADDPFVEQGDLGLDDVPRADAVPPAPRPTTDEGQNRLARLKGAARAQIPPAQRSDLFPDIEEINSTLRSDADRDPLDPLPTEQAAKDRKSGRTGFVGMMGLILVAVLVYVFADPIVAAVPALDGVMVEYVDTVNDGRIWLDAQAQALARALNSSS